MKRMTILLTVMGLMLAMGAGAALAAIGPIDGVVRIGDNGPNRLVGTAESDRLSGRGGNDVLIGRADSDILLGGAGNDRIDARDPGRGESDRINCGPGRDRVLIDPGTEDIVRNCEIVRVAR